MKLYELELSYRDKLAKLEYHENEKVSIDFLINEIGINAIYNNGIYLGYDENDLIDKGYKLDDKVFYTIFTDLDNYTCVEIEKYKE